MILLFISTSLINTMYKKVKNNKVYFNNTREQGLITLTLRKNKFFYLAFTYRGPRPGLKKNRRFFLSPRWG